MGRDVVIWGITGDGRTFRPSDWSDRLAGLTSAFDRDQRLAYSPLVQPLSLGGIKAVIVDSSLADLEPRFFEFLRQFARDNDLGVTEAENALQHRDALVPPPPKKISAGPREPV